MTQIQISSRKKIAFSLILIAFLWLVIELSCLAALGYLKKYKHLEYQPRVIEDLNDKHKGILAAQIADTSSYMVFDPELGWTIRPNGNNFTGDLEGLGNILQSSITYGYTCDKTTLSLSSHVYSSVFTRQE